MVPTSQPPPLKQTLLIHTHNECTAVKKNAALAHFVCGDHCSMELSEIQSCIHVCNDWQLVQQRVDAFIFRCDGQQQQASGVRHACV